MKKNKRTLYIYMHLYFVICEKAVIEQNSKNHIEYISQVYMKSMICLQYDGLYLN